ncbi:MAG: hypothetical protein GTN89_04850 [Acidobacteria bacterium]|nr:hypothetical protein [Acidobacteriota bacterium]NIM60682.1 hypothetical protein [Acidobacteriota bacterium]NIO58642.1 hypothetical protein [Acidobacteriota bacterium]NIQ29698.1 hypothetical protein [Acidobacteriota bacterium]NIQ84415.1 hypothetical protein [Acidobacteriota bacterium]
MKTRRTLLLFFSLILGGVSSVTAGETETPMIDIPNALEIQAGVLGGGQPDEAALRAAADAGYRTIVNTREPGEKGELENQAELIRSLGMNYVTIPTRSGSSFNEENAKRLAEILDDPEAYPVMVHCASGNRVGILFAVKAYYLDDVAGPEALELGKRAGARRIPVEVEKLLSGE